MSPNITLTPLQRSMLRRLVAGVSAHQTKELSLMLFMAIFLVLEILEVAPDDIETVFGVDIARFLNELVDGGSEEAIKDVAQTPVSACPPHHDQSDANELIIAGHRVPCIGTVSSDGHITFSEIGHRWLQEQDNAIQC